jgi:DNA polymerase V
VAVVGISLKRICVGFAPTKTLAKLANNIAKKHTTTGVFVITENNRLDVLKKTDVGDIWGIGMRSAEKLMAQGIYTGLDLINSDDDLIRRLITIVGLRTTYELRGTQAVIDEPQQAKSVSTSRSFGQPVSSLKHLKEALACYIETAYGKLQRRDLFAGGISVYLKTNQLRTDAPQYSNIISDNLDFSQNNLSSLIKTGSQLLERIYRSGYQFIKVGIIFSDLFAEKYQPSLFEDQTSIKSNSDLDLALDKIKGKFGNKSVFHAVQGIERPWSMKQDSLSPKYTTCWDEIKVVKI